MIMEVLLDHESFHCSLAASPNLSAPPSTHCTLHAVLHYTLHTSLYTAHLTALHTVHTLHCIWQCAHTVHCTLHLTHSTCTKHKLRCSAHAEGYNTHYMLSNLTPLSANTSRKQHCNHHTCIIVLNMICTFLFCCLKSPESSSSVNVGPPTIM